MPSLINNFSPTESTPIDYRIVVTNTSERDNIEYKYDGMQVFTTNDRIVWTYNFSNNSWVDNSFGNGIYGGSGSLIGNTYVDVGGIGNSVGSQSNYFILSGSSSILNFHTYYNKHTNINDWTSIELIKKFSVDANNSYISFNPKSNNYNDIDIEFGANNSKKFTILSDNGILIYSPTYSAKFLPSSLSSNQTYSLPDKSGIIAMNQDLNLQYITNTGNTSSVPVIIMNNVGSTDPTDPTDPTLYKGMLDSGSVSFYKGNTFSSSLDNDGVLKLGNSANQYVASIVSATLSNNFTYLLPSVRTTGVFFMQNNYYIYQMLGMSGNYSDGQLGKTYSICFVKPRSIYGVFSITRIIFNNISTTWQSGGSHSTKISIGQIEYKPTGFSYSANSFGSYPSGYFNKGYNSIWELKTNISNNYRTSSQYDSEIIVRINNTVGNAVTDYTFDIFIEGYYKN